jgi:hypothetical protein
VSGGTTPALASNMRDRNGNLTEQMHVVGQERAGGVIVKYTGFKISPCPKHQDGRNSSIYKAPC